MDGAVKHFYFYHRRFLNSTPRPVRRQPHSITHSSPDNSIFSLQNISRRQSPYLVAFLRLPQDNFWLFSVAKCDLSINFHDVLLAFD